MELLEAALAFYKTGPDYQYDLDVVVPLLEAEIARRHSQKVWELPYPKEDRP